MDRDPGEHVIVVVLDTVRKDHLPPYGYDRPTAPSLAEFAESATVFDDAVTQAPWTLPSHASMFTGQYPHEHGATQSQPYLTHDTTLATALAAAGYHTACYSANAWITPYTGLTTGFDTYDNFFEILPTTTLDGALAKTWRTLNENERLRSVADRLVALGNRIHEYLATDTRADSKTPRVIDTTIEFLDSVDNGFVFINLMDAHLPYHPPPESKELLAPGIDPATVCQNSKAYNSGARTIDPDEWNAITHLYDAEIRHMDTHIERLFNWLRTTDQWDDSLVIVCADHGELHGEHNLFGHEFNLYDPVITVPLIIRHPAHEPTSRPDQVELLDLYHTILEFAGATTHSTPTAYDHQRSLFSPDYRSFPAAEYALIEYDCPVIELTQLEAKANAADIPLSENSRFYSRIDAARRPDAKYIRNERIPDEFYRLDDDPTERHNRIDTDDPAITELQSVLERIPTTRTSTSREGHQGRIDSMSSTARERLRDLGYLE